jgi:hypothetical protein
MAYAPGVVDRSGEILAQGRLAGGMAALGGISQGIQTYQKNKLQNQVLSNENDSLIAGLQQLQQMGGGATMSNLAPAGMEKLIQKHLEGGGLNLSDSMKLNSMLNTTLKTAQVGQQMQAQRTQAELNQKRIENEIATGRQAQADVVGIGKVLQELSGQELTPDKVVAAASKVGLSAGAIDSLTQSLGRLAPPKPQAAPAGYRFTASGDLQAIPGGPADKPEPAPEGFRWFARPDGSRALEPIPGGPAAIKVSEAEGKKVAEAEARQTLADDAKLSAATTLTQVQRARDLIDRPLAQGLGSSISGFFGGTSGQDLEATYDVIRANEALTRIIALKKASPTGSTGFGALNLKELEVLQSRFAKLSRSVSDESAKKALDDLEGVLLKAFPDLKQTKASQSTPVRTRRFDPASGRLIDVAGDRVD